MSECASQRELSKLPNLTILCVSVEVRAGGRLLAVHFVQEVVLVGRVLVGRGHADAGLRQCGNPRGSQEGCARREGSPTCTLRIPSSMTRC